MYLLVKTPSTFLALPNMLSPPELDTLEAVVRITASISLICLGIMASDIWRKWSKMRNAPSRIVLWFTISAAVPLPLMLLGRSQVPLTEDEDPNPLCLAQAATMTFAFFSQALWSAFMGLNVYLAIVRQLSLGRIRKREYIYHCVAWGVPSFLAVAPMVRPIVLHTPNSVYGNAGMFCWVARSFQSTRVFALLVPLWALFVFTFLVYHSAIKTVRKALNSEDLARSRTNHLAYHQHLKARLRLTVKTALYLLAFFLTYIGLTINRVAVIFMGEERFVYFLLHALTFPSVGLFAAIAYFGNQFISCFGMDQFGSSTDGGSTSGGTSDRSRIGTGAGRSDLASPIPGFAFIHSPQTPPSGNDGSGGRYGRGTAILPVAPTDSSAVFPGASPSQVQLIHLPDPPPHLGPIQLSQAYLGAPIVDPIVPPAYDAIDSVARDSVEAGQVGIPPRPAAVPRGVLPPLPQQPRPRAQTK
ncbi:hypothetical protein BCR44DRAFT_64929 [Catenaria anguillulae PL171]|uniref:G-protein coupled receptors family 2 profile 2 domain-containing protein n=1 Tax=Catenaria anguillulae PL171 TaxID=765915 RepID=A0A1Y2H782_9FUNG|nr:hypothetical protein BCR44DRAFT_64929 [Catenaria anguillulae PL171]